MPFRLKLFLFLAAVLQALACASPFVAYSTFAGVGDVRTDGAALIAFGDVAGEAGVFAKGSNLPVVIPFQVDQGYVLLYRQDTGERRVQPLSAPLPAWARSLIPPVHEAHLEELLGVDLQFE